VNTLPTPYAKGNSEVVATQCVRGVAVRVEGSLEAVDNPTGRDSKAAHATRSCWATMPVQPPREVPVKMAGDRQSRKKHSERIASYRTLEGGMDSPKEGTVRQKQCGADSTGNEAWTTSKTGGQVSESV
jgi:hypothetical protein